eukprot:199423-Hanusia_phi.AAC.2
MDATGFVRDCRGLAVTLFSSSSLQGPNVTTKDADLNRFSNVDRGSLGEVSGRRGRWPWRRQRKRGSRKSDGGGKRTRGTGGAGGAEEKERREKGQEEAERRVVLSLSQIQSAFWSGVLNLTGLVDGKEVMSEFEYGGERRRRRRYEKKRCCRIVREGQELEGELSFARAGPLFFALTLSGAEDEVQLRVQDVLLFSQVSSPVCLLPPLLLLSLPLLFRCLASCLLLSPPPSSSPPASSHRSSVFFFSLSSFSSSCCYSGTQPSTCRCKQLSQVHMNQAHQASIFLIPSPRLPLCLLSSLSSSCHSSPLPPSLHYHFLTFSLSSLVTLIECRFLSVPAIVHRVQRARGSDAGDVSEEMKLSVLR